MYRRCGRGEVGGMECNYVRRRKGSVSSRRICMYVHGK